MDVPPIRALDARGEIRPVQEVAIEEIQAAALAILDMQFSLSREDLIVAIARALGYKSTKSQVSARIGLAFEGLEQVSAVENVGGRVKRNA